MGQHGARPSVSQGTGQGFGASRGQQIIQAGLVGAAQQGQAGDLCPATSRAQCHGQGAGGGGHLRGGARALLRIKCDQPGAIGHPQQLQRRDQAGGAIGPDAAAHLNARQRHSSPASRDGGEGLFPAFADQQL